MNQMLVIAAVVLAGPGCGIIGPSCLNRQDEGAVASLASSVGAGQLATHLVAYDTRGSQNNAQLDWDGMRDADGPRLDVYATRVSCEDFTLPANNNTGNCAVIATAGWRPEGVATTLFVTHGRGNPEVLGNPPEYKLWVTSDKLTSYTISISYFYGPDC